MSSPAQFLLTDAERAMDKLPAILPFMKQLLPVGFLWIEEIFNFRLFKLKRSKHKLTGSDFIAETLADLTNTKRQLYTCWIENIGEVGKNPARSRHADKPASFLPQLRRCRLGYDIEAFWGEYFVMSGVFARFSL